MTAGRKGSWSGGGLTDGELLAGTADRLRWRAPELALEFARQAAARAESDQDRALALRSSALVVAALVRLGRHAEAVEPAVLALREAEAVGERELAGALRVDLAASARAVGLAGSALVIVRPMLEGGHARPAVRAGALAEIVGGLAQAKRRDVVDEVLSEADRLYAADETLVGDVRRVLRALLCARIASFRRRWGNATGAVAAATEGMMLLDGLTDPHAESGQARAELGLEMVSALLDAGETAAALGQAEQTLNYPVRATTAAAIGRLMFVLATRVHVPAGEVVAGHALFVEIVRIARRHELDTLLADVFTALAHEQEAAGELPEALDSLRSARAAEHRRLRADTLARMVVLEELGAGTRLPADTEALLRRVVRSPARTVAEPAAQAAPDRTSGELDAPSVAVGEPRWPGQETPGERDSDTSRLSARRRLAAARRQARPTALTLVRLEPSHEPEPEPEPRDRDPDSTDRFSASLIKALDRSGPEFDPDVLSSLAGHVREMAPDDAELVVRPEEGEVAVLLHDTTKDEAEQFAATLRETVSGSDWDIEDPARGVHVSTGVAQYQEGATEDSVLSAAREALTSTDTEGEHDRPNWQSVEPVYDLPPDDDSYTYIEEYTQSTQDDQEPVDEEMAAYLAGFSLPEYRQWPPADEPEPPTPKHDAASTPDEGRSVLDRLGITRGSGGGRRRAPDSFEFEQDQPAPPSRDMPSEAGDVGRHDPDGTWPDPTMESSSHHQFHSSEENPGGGSGSGGGGGRRYKPDTHSPDPGAHQPYQADPSGYDADLAAYQPDRGDDQADRSGYPADPSSRRTDPSGHLADPSSHLVDRSGYPAGLSGFGPDSAAHPAAHSSAGAQLISGTGDEILAAAAAAYAAQASIPSPPDPDEIPDPPDSPEVPIPPDPDVEPQPQRQTPPKEPGSPDVPIPPDPDVDPVPRRRRTPVIPPEEPDEDPGSEPSPRRQWASATAPDDQPPRRRRRAPDPNPMIAAQNDPSPAAGSDPARRDSDPLSGRQDLSRSDSDPRASRRAADLPPLRSDSDRHSAGGDSASGHSRSDSDRRASRGDSDRPSLRSDSGSRSAVNDSASRSTRSGSEHVNRSDSERLTRNDSEPQPTRESARRTGSAARRARSALPPEPSEPLDPPVGTDAQDEAPRRDDRPSRMRRREKTDVGLADLLAEALVAYQSSHLDDADEDVLSTYDDLSAASGPLGPDSGRHTFPDRAPAERDNR